MPSGRNQAHFHLALGVEEEFLIVDPASGDVLKDPDPRLFEYCEKHASPHRMMHEFLCSQIESNTRVCAPVSDLRELDCESELLHVLDIIRDGTSADRQVDHYRLRRLEGDSAEQALQSVVQLAIEETREGL